MTPCDASLWTYHIPSDEWKQLPAEGDVPEERSYHCMAVSGDNLYRTSFPIVRLSFFANLVE